jgi:hypothetical protein
MAHIGFDLLKAKLAAKGDVTDPAAVAASIGRKKYGKAGMAVLAKAGDKKQPKAAAMFKAAGKKPAA